MGSSAILKSAPKNSVYVKCSFFNPCTPLYVCGSYCISHGSQTERLGVRDYRVEPMQGDVLGKLLLPAAGLAAAAALAGLCEIQKLASASCF